MGELAPVLLLKRSHTVKVHLKIHVIIRNANKGGGSHEAGWRMMGQHLGHSQMCGNPKGNPQAWGLGIS